jgi:7,8-dihydroneopterin aldolase/epimerase/oxygenase
MKIVLEGMEFYAFHGVFEQEKKIGGNYTVDIEIHADLKDAVSGDEISKTIDYGEVYTAIKIEMDKSANLIEHVAGRIVKALFSQFELIEGIRLRINKLNPPLNGKAKLAGFEIEHARNAKG